MQGTHAVSSGAMPRGLLLLTGALWAAATLWATPANAQSSAATDAAAAQAVLDQVDELEGEKLWSAAGRLEALGTEALPVIRKSLSRGSEKARLAAAKATLRVGDADAKSEAVQTLKDLIKGPAAKETRVAAIEIAGKEADPEEVLEFLEKTL
jgi:hypothetical protein